MDTKGDESEWSDPFIVSMPIPKNILFNRLTLFFERFPNAFPLIRNLLGL